MMQKIILWGLTASPYQLKMQSLIDFSGHEWVRWPDQASRLTAISMALRLAAAKRRRAVLRYPAMSKQFDEYPAVPFYSLDGRSFYYDSSSLASHLDSLVYGSPVRLRPHNACLAFICQLIDEAFDEFGLYLAHHMRWVGSAKTTTMGQITAQELRPLLPPGTAGMVARKLTRRQVLRCPYLLSVAPEDFESGVGSDQTPPSRAGFPQTHQLLETAWRSYLAALEYLLQRQPYLLGAQFTLADASAYGQLGMNLVDPEAIALLGELAPHTFRWLCAIHHRAHVTGQGELALTPALKPLLQTIGETFVPLMLQNERAYQNALSTGETLFNEAAFKQGRGLYDGQLLGLPFRAVVKTFQVGVWRDLKASWHRLSRQEQDSLQQEFLPYAALAFGASDSV